MSKNFSRPTDDPLWMKKKQNTNTKNNNKKQQQQPQEQKNKEANAGGVSPFLHAIVEPDTLASVRLSLIAAAIAVPLNSLFGVAAAWFFAMFDFPG